MPDEVVLDEWTVVMRGDASLSWADVERLSQLVDSELAGTVRHLTLTLAPSATVEVLPR
jgi:hypothetical protein